MLLLLCPRNCLVPFSNDALIYVLYPVHHHLITREMFAIRDSKICVCSNSNFHSLRNTWNFNFISYTEKLCVIPEDSKLPSEEFAATEGICWPLPDYAIAGEEIILWLSPGEIFRVSYLILYTNKHASRLIFFFIFTGYATSRYKTGRSKDGKT